MADRRRAHGRHDLPPGVRARRAEVRHEGDRADGPHRHDDQLPARQGGLRGGRLRGGHAGAAPARDGLPDARAAHQARRRARRGHDDRVPLRGRDPRLRRVRERREGSGAQADRLLRGRERPGRGRGRDAVELVLPGLRLHVRQQHQHARGRHAPLGLQGCADRNAQPRRAPDDAAQGEGREPRRRGRPRGARRGDLGEAARPAVRGADEDEARQPGHPRPRRADGEREARAVLRGEPDRGAPGDQQGDPGVARASGGAQGARAHAPQERARELVAAGQARRLPDQRPFGRGALPRRGELGRRIGSRRARPPLPGDPAAARQGDQLREEPDQQGALERRDPGDHHGDRHGHRRGVRPREAALPPRDRDDRRRRRRLAHPHA